MHAWTITTDLSLNLDQAILHLVESRAHGGEFGADVSRGRGRAINHIGSHTPRDSLRNHSCLIFHCYKRSIRSTTPTIAESIAAPTWPVAAVDAPQPSCT